MLSTFPANYLYLLGQLYLATQSQLFYRRYRGGKKNNLNINVTIAQFSNGSLKLPSGGRGGRVDVFTKAL